MELVKMRARYKLTEFLSEYINTIREKTLGYTHEEFSKILNIEPSSSYYLCKNTRTQYITIERLISIFAVKYNIHLFMLKSEKMLEIVELAKKDGKLDEKMTLKKMFGTRSTISEKRNKLLTKPPIEIFTKQKCPVNEEDFIKNYNSKFFDENLFPPELRYVPIPTPNDIYNPSDEMKSHLIRIKSYIGEEMDLLMKHADKYDLKSEYWVIALYFMYKDITLTESCWEFIRKCYNTDSWLNIFKSLGKNENLKHAYTMQDEDIIYFRDKKESEITEDNLPVFYYKYKSSLNDKIDYENDYYEPEREDAAEYGKMKLLHLFYIIYNHYLSLGKSENDAFKETCFRLYADNVDSTFIKFDILNYPYVKDNMNLNSDAFKLYLHIKDFFDNNKIDENEKDLLAFKRNCEALGSRLFDVISVDFTFIKKLNTTFDEKLNHNLNRTVNEFKKNLLL